LNKEADRTVWHSALD